MEPEVARRIGQARAEVSADLDSAERWGTLGMVFQAHELYPEARNSYKVARSLGDGDFRWPYLQSRCHLELQEIGPAIEALGAALALEPAYAPLRVLEAELHEKEGRLDWALVSYRAALAIDAGSAAAELGVGRVLLEKGEIGESLKHLEKAAELQPRSGSIRAMLARASNRAGNEERARAAAELARALPPEVVLEDRVMASVAELAVSLVGYQRRAAEAEARGEPRRAEELLRHLVSLRPEEADLHYNLANNLSRQERFAEAKESYEETLALDPGHTSALINLGILWSRTGELPEARRVFEKALALSPDDPEALASLAKVTALEGDTDAAIRLFRRPGRARIAPYPSTSRWRTLDRTSECLAPHSRIPGIGPDPSRGFRQCIDCANARPVKIQGITPITGSWIQTLGENRSREPSREKVISTNSSRRRDLAGSMPSRGAWHGHCSIQRLGL
jgi:tetratricopeptide (TPR) repeat protein